MARCEYIEVDGALAFVEMHGDGHPVLCLHTAGQSGMQWRHVGLELPSHGFQVVIPDLPGHGRSEMARTGPVTDIAAYAAWCARMLEVLGLDEPFVVGCSIGGKIALEMAVSAATELAGVVAMEADRRNTFLSVTGLERGLEDAASPSRTDRTFLGTLASCGRSVAPERARRIAEVHRREDPVISTSDLIAWTRHDFTGRLGEIRCPVHLVAGSDDFWIDAAQVEEMAEEVPGATFERLAGIGHYPMEEMEDFGARVAQWIEEMLVGREAQGGANNG